MSENKPPKAGAHLTELLIGTYGFALSDGRPGEYLKTVDAQHALVIRDKYWEKRRYGKTPTTANLSFKVARRDINNLWRELLNPEIVEWRGSVQVNYRLFGDDWRRPTIDTFVPGTFENFLDEWIPKFAQLANLPEIYTMLDELKHNEELTGSSKIPRMMNTMLDGKWDDDAHEEFLAGKIRTLTELEPGHPHRVACEREIPLVQAWLADHPNGIDRELTT